jgi:hypothetical protein
MPQELRPAVISAATAVAQAAARLGRPAAVAAWQSADKCCARLSGSVSGGGEGFDDSHSGMDTEGPEQPASIDRITAAKVAMTSATRDMPPPLAASLDQPTVLVKDRPFVANLNICGARQTCATLK